MRRTIHAIYVLLLPVVLITVFSWVLIADLLLNGGKSFFEAFHWIRQNALF